MGTPFKPPSYSPRLQSYLDRLRKGHETKDRPTGYVRPPLTLGPPAPPTPPPQEEPGMLMSGLAAIQSAMHSIDQNLGDLPANIAAPG